MCNEYLLSWANRGGDSIFKWQWYWNYVRNARGGMVQKPQLSDINRQLEIPEGSSVESRKEGERK